MHCDRLFVYGSLRRAARPDIHARFLTGAEFIGEGTAPGRLYQITWYPAMVASASPEHRVKGELYRLTDLEKMIAGMDEFEGFDPQQPDHGEYVRRIETITLANGTQMTAWLYLFLHDPSTASLIPSGDFLDAQPGK
jgi:gamma-glutamylcyclotransferase (GGCT)/AIG2-like uncharacterized protein YtfP